MELRSRACGGGRSLCLSLVRTLPLALVLLLLLALPSRAAEPFSRLAVTLQGAGHLATDELGEYWTPRPAAGGGLSAPVGFGTLRAGLLYQSFTADAGEVAGYDSRYLWLGWELGLPLPGGLELALGLRSGSYRMDFDDPTLQETLRVETELATGVGGGLAWRGPGGLLLRGELLRLTLHTYHPSHFWLAALGVGWEAELPGTVREVLR
jgi:hypothetical protein